MSTQGQPAAPWREEVNRRLAEHNRRKGNPSPASAPAQPAAPGSSRAAQAAARVAARFAKAQSYNDMQAEEARIAVRAAEIATQVALEAQSVAETALAELHAATVEIAPAEPAQLIPFESAPRQTEIVAEPQIAPEPEPQIRSEQIQSEQILQELARPEQAQPKSVLAPAPPPIAAHEWDWTADTIAPASAAIVAEPVVEAAPAIAALAPAQSAPEIPARIESGPVTDAKASSGQLLQIRWEPDMPIRSAHVEPELFELASEDWWTPAEPASHREEPVEIEAHTIPANLIQFPRELVATRRIRPHNVEGPTPEPGVQLSIFEVDPGTIQTEAPAPEPVAPAWTPADRISAEPLTSTPAAAAEEIPAPAASTKSDWSAPEWSGMKLGAHPRTEPAAPALINKLSLAPLSTRLMAGLVDSAIAVAIATFLWLTFAFGSAHTLEPRSAELLGLGALVFAALAYHAFFCLISMPTLGMRYAGLSLCTFDEMIPTPQQLRRRFSAMIVSMLPMGLGMAWSLFDEDHLAWHDRYSQTYLRRH